MESNWRWNVARLGMSGTDWRLCARVVNLEDVDDVYLVDTGSAIRWRLVRELPAALPANIGFVGSGGKNFPSNTSDLEVEND